MQRLKKLEKCRKVILHFPDAMATAMLSVLQWLAQPQRSSLLASILIHKLSILDKNNAQEVARTYTYEK